MPLLVLVGFASCHWCHVLARETFRDPDAAELINRRFVPVVVDRQERPDLDRYYMSACQATGEGGGWPLLAAALADGRPFFIYTYRLLNGPEGMYETLLAIANLWEADRPTAEQP